MPLEAGEAHAVWLKRFGLVIAAIFALGLLANGLNSFRALKAGASLPGLFVTFVVTSGILLGGAVAGFGLAHRNRNALTALWVYAVPATLITLLVVGLRLSTTAILSIEGIRVSYLTAFLVFAQWVIVYAVPLGYCLKHKRELPWRRRGE